MTEDIVNVVKHQIEVGIDAELESKTTESHELSELWDLLKNLRNVFKVNQAKINAQASHYVLKKGFLVGHHLSRRSAQIDLKAEVLRQILHSLFNLIRNSKGTNFLELSASENTISSEHDIPVLIAQFISGLLVSSVGYFWEHDVIELFPSWFNSGPSCFTALDTNISEAKSIVIFVSNFLVGDEVLGLLLPLIIVLSEQIKPDTGRGRWILWLIESQVDALLDGLLILVHKLHQFWISQGTRKSAKAISELKHGSLLARVGFHTGEVPSLELVVVDDAVTVQVQILEGSLLLLLVKLVAEVSAKFGELVLVDGT